MSKQRFEELKTLTEKWAYERGITVNGKLSTQMLKLVSEAGELSGHFLPGNEDKLKDDIGDCVVVLCNMAVLSGSKLEYIIEDYKASNMSTLLNFNATLGKLADAVIKNQDIKPYIDKLMCSLNTLSSNMLFMDITECWSEAYNDIKGRKGFLNEHGNFIKNTDPGYEEAYNKFMAEQRQLKMEL